MNKELFQRLQAAWAGRTPRERRFLLAGAALVLVAILYGGLWTPLQRDLVRLRAEAPRAAEDLRWMRAQAPRAQALRARAQAASGNLLAAIEQTAVAQRVRGQITRIDAEGPKGARVALDAVPFNALVSWLAELRQTSAIAVEDATIEATPTAGTVNARLRLRLGGA